jgi:hypothetical protein
LIGSSGGTPYARRTNLLSTAVKDLLLERVYGRLIEADPKTD